MIRATFRVSEVESFRQWRDDPDADLDVLLDRLRGQTEPSEVMLAGTAFHQALEDAPTGLTATSLGANGYTFNMEGDFTIGLCGIREVRAGKTYRGEGYEITVSGQLDAIHGKRVEDHKTTSRFDPERYLAGYQWRLYLDIFGADHFRWNVFEIACNDDALPAGMVWDVHAQHTLEQFRYPGMEADCARLVRDLADFTRAQLPERIRALEPA